MTQAFMTDLIALISSDIGRQIKTKRFPLPKCIATDFRQRNEATTYIGRIVSIDISIVSTNLGNVHVSHHFIETFGLLGELGLVNKRVAIHLSSVVFLVLA